MICSVVSDYQIADTVVIFVKDNKTAFLFYPRKNSEKSKARNYGNFRKSGGAYALFYLFFYEKLNDSVGKGKVGSRSVKLFLVLSVSQLNGKNTIFYGEFFWGR